MRTIDEFVANLADLVPGGIGGLAFFSVLAAIIVSVLWYLWPYRFRSGRRGERRTARAARAEGARRFRLGRLRWRWPWWRRRKRRPRADAELDELPPDELPDLPAEVLLDTADQLALAGRYAEAVRERLRGIVRSLIERGVLPATPGWTVTELAAAAGQARAALAPPLAGAAGVFSEIWYGLRPATRADDEAMRAHADAVQRVLADAAVTAGRAS